VSNSRFGDRHMCAFDNGLSRISKLLIDRNATSPGAALAQRRAHGVTLCCGDDVASSYTLQLATLTAARIATRCFPGAVRFSVTPALAQAPLLIWPWLHRTFGDALVEILEVGALSGSGVAASRALVFGNAPSADGAYRVTFDGWIAKVGPANKVARLAEREYFPVAGILAASLALSELFLSFADISLEAARRTVGLSLWRPDLDIGEAEALGLPVEFLPGAMWVLGLGHLGNAYLWSLATLPYEEPSAVEFALFDFDKVEKDNVETGVLLTADDVDSFKAHACNAWLRRHKFKARLVERRFDATFRVQAQEPLLALCGFDSNPSRRDLPHAQFRRVIDSGLGGMANNFDTIACARFRTRARRMTCGPTWARKKWRSSSPTRNGWRARIAVTVNSVVMSAAGATSPASRLPCLLSAPVPQASSSPKPCACCTTGPAISTSGSRWEMQAGDRPAAAEATRPRMPQD
jgi:hypothetical protein